MTRKDNNSNFIHSFIHSFFIHFLFFFFYLKFGICRYQFFRSFIPFISFINFIHLIHSIHFISFLNDNWYLQIPSVILHSFISFILLKKLVPNFIHSSILYSFFFFSKVLRITLRCRKHYFFLTLCVFVGIPLIKPFLTVD
jgi:hypothetical protein